MPTLRAAATQDGENNYIIDILVLYPTEVAALLGATPAARTAAVNLRIAEANEIFTNSAINVRFRLVHDEINDVISKKPQESVEINTPAVQALRDLYGADIVSHWNVGGTGAKGTGLLFSGTSNKAGYNTVIYSEVVSKYSFVHECGHNLGASHNREEYSSNTAKLTTLPGYQFGKQFATYRTIMSYGSDSSKPRIKAFSSPTVFYNSSAKTFSNGTNTNSGVATGIDVSAGISTTLDGGPADNARRINECAQYVSAANNPVVDGEPPIITQDGTEEHPYLINNRTDLETLRSSYQGDAGINKYFLLTADIDLSSSSWTRPSQTTANAFRGKFNGNGHSITGMNVSGSTNSGSSYNFGFFGVLGAGAVIENLTLSGTVAPTGAGTTYVGGLAGYINVSLDSIGDVIIRNNNINVTINSGTTASTNYTGGVIGYVNATTSNVTIENNIYVGNIAGTANYVGGIVGYSVDNAFDTKILNCYSDANVTTNRDADVSIYAGGIVGYASNSAATGLILIENCFASGTVKILPGVVTSDKGRVGGIAGRAGGGSAGAAGTTIRNCVAAQSEISSKGGTATRINAAYSTVRTLENNYAFADISVDGASKTSTSLTSTDGKGIALSLLKASVTYGNSGAKWDFDDIWTIREGATFPYLQIQSNPVIITSLSNLNATLNVVVPTAIQVYKGVDLLTTLFATQAGDNRFLLSGVTANDELTFITTEAGKVASFPTSGTAVQGKATISFEVTDDEDEDVISNATIKLIDSSLNETLNDMSDYEFTELENGTYTYEITKAGYYLKSGSIEVDGANVIENVMLQLDPSAIPHTVTFTVQDANGPILDAVVKLDGEESTETNKYLFTGVYDAIHPYTVEKAGYATATGNVTVAGGDETPTVTLLPTYTLTFDVKDFKNAAVTGATITLKDAEENVIDPDAGEDYQFTVVAGTYTYTIAKEGYITTTEESVIVTNVAIQENVVLHGALGAEDNPILITNRTDLENIKNGLDKTYRLTADIDLNGRDWAPVGTSSSTSLFKGKLYGGGHKISNLNYTGTAQYVGLFGVLGQGAYIDSLQVIGGTISVTQNKTGTSTSNDPRYIGAIAGYAVNTSALGDSSIVIQNCYSDVNLKVTLSNSSSGGTNGSRIGGIVGRAYANSTGTGGGITIESNYSKSSIEVISTQTTRPIENYAGGVVGAIDRSALGKVNILNNYSNTSIKTTETGTPTTYLGGVLGYQTGNASNPAFGIIEKNYATGSIDGGSATAVGGIVGYSSRGVIQNSVALLNSVDGTVAGRIVGTVSNTTLANNYAEESILVNDVLITDGTATDKNGLDKTTTELKTAATYAAWNFADVWTIRENASFPYFQYQSAPVVVTTLHPNKTEINALNAGSVDVYQNGTKTTLVVTAGVNDLTSSFTVAVGDEFAFVTNEAGKAPSYPVSKTAVAPPTYAVTFTVKDDETPITDAKVTLDDQELTEGTAQGEYVFYVEDGTYAYEVAKLGYDTIRVANLEVNGAAVPVAIALVPTAYDVTFTVTNGREAITDAEITFNGVTNTAGDYAFTAINGVDYEYSVAKTGYETSEGKLTVNNAAVEKPVTLTLTTYSVTFDLNGIEDAVITLDGQTNEANDYVFEGILPGDYNYSVTKLGYDPIVDADVSVVDQNVTEPVTLTATLYTVTFDLGIHTDASVTFNSVEKTEAPYTFQVSNGGPYYYTIVKEGYHTISSSLSVENNGVSVPITLVSDATPVYNVTFTVNVSDAIITLDGVPNAEGNYLFSNVEDGTYDYSVVRDGYETANGQVTVSGANATEDVVLTPISYTITYEDLYGAENTNQATYTIENELITLVDPGERAGYTFEGWYDNEELTGDAVTSIAAGSTGNKVFYAKWAVVPPTTFDVTFVVKDAEEVAITDAVVTLNNVTNETGDYVFAAIEVGTYDYSVSKDGYVTATGSVMVTDDNVTENVTLQLDIPNNMATIDGFVTKLYPNPVKDILHVTVNEDAPVLVEIYGTTGTKYLSQTSATKSFEVNVSTCPSGTLIMKISTSAGSVIKKIVKQ
ncbi:MAG: T9SS type A sorting domain-containing protein [Candidatus Symbiothrix sp.]|jgi:uncharacterized repeat protein (TIGR02543 family)|nr:T9SS type A sorting domain-containing protein [Candidatus Symbiothrix sp.]